MAWTGWLTFDTIRYGWDVAVPLQVVHSEAVDPPDGVKEFYGLEPQVTIAVQAVVKHFDSTLQENKLEGE